MLSRYPPKPGCLYQSEQGIEYTAHDFCNMVCSMCCKGNPLDKTTVESFSHTMKAGLIYHKLFENDIEAMTHIVEFTGFYHRERLYSSIDYHSPENYGKLSA